jgi:cytochrome c oxidase subunit 7c
MLSRAAIRASSTTSMVARRGFHSTRAQMSSPYHYPEGPRSNIPFNPLTKWFALRYWSFMFIGFCTSSISSLCRSLLTYHSRSFWRCSLADVQEQVKGELGLGKMLHGCRILKDIDRGRAANRSSESIQHSQSHCSQWKGLVIKIPLKFAFL